MAKSDAGIEIPKLAESLGFKRSFKFYGKETYSVGYFHRGRTEGFTLRSFTETEAFDVAYWHAPSRWRTIVDRRAPGARGKDGRSLVSNNKRRGVGLDEVRPEEVTSPRGLPVTYTELKRRLNNENWIEGIK